METCALLASVLTVRKTVLCSCFMERCGTMSIWDCYWINIVFIWSINSLLSYFFFVAIWIFCKSYIFTYKKNSLKENIIPDFSLQNMINSRIKNIYHKQQNFFHLPFSSQTIEPLSNKFLCSLQAAALPQKVFMIRLRIWRMTFGTNLY